jgi:threonine dehydratase
MRSKLQGKRVGVLVSGGNVDVERYCALLTA